MVWSTANCFKGKGNTDPYASYKGYNIEKQSTLLSGRSDLSSPINYFRLEISSRTFCDYMTTNVILSITKVLINAFSTWEIIRFQAKHVVSG